MSISDEDIAFVTDHFSEAGPISTRKMFGGLAIYADGTILALLMGSGNLMLKAKGDLAQALQDEGCTQIITPNPKHQPLCPIGRFQMLLWMITN